MHNLHRRSASSISGDRPNAGRAWKLPFPISPSPRDPASSMMLPNLHPSVRHRPWTRPDDARDAVRNHKVTRQINHRVATATRSVRGGARTCVTKRTIKTVRTASFPFAETSCRSLMFRRAGNTRCSSRLPGTEASTADASPRAQAVRVAFCLFSRIPVNVHSMRGVGGRTMPSRYTTQPALLRDATGAR
ncbi:hypothetical protein LZ30DRAFT_131539 [Colletotrichum cereale]|nr:hypothetical protein LZ30DRAFT_131539 [Colletotrichum cereale]